MSIKVVIIDDEPKAIDLLSNYIAQIDNLILNATFRDPVKAHQYLIKTKVDLLLLDINMPRLSGIELYKSLVHPPHVIFTTAHPEYAVTGFELEALDYLLKPVSLSRFLKSVQKVLQAQASITKASGLPSDPLYIKSGHTDHKLIWRDVLFLEKDENYVIYHFQNGKRLLERTTLSEVESTFPTYIMRIHKSYAVCLHHISSVGGMKIKVDDIELPLGRKNKDAFYRRYTVHKQKFGHG